MSHSVKRGLNASVTSLLNEKKIKSICRQQNKCDSKKGNLLGKDRKHCRKRRKCWLPAFSLFPTVFPKDSFTSRDCVGKS